MTTILIIIAIAAVATAARRREANDRGRTMYAIPNALAVAIRTTHAGLRPVAFGVWALRA